MRVTRIPTQADLQAILQLTRANRSRRATLEPDFWRKSANADVLHEMFVTFQIGNDQLIKRVLERDGRVIGYAVSARHPSGFYFIDDVCLDADADWLTDGVHLLKSIEERPAIMTAPHGDTARVDAARAARLAHIATVRSLRFDQEPPLALDTAPVPVAAAVPENLPAPPIHPFLPALAPGSMTAIGDGRGGYALVSPAMAAPPIYDPGGKPSVVDRVIGKDRQALLKSALRFAARRGDLGVILIVAADDFELSAIADRLGAGHPVDIFKWPD
jgi:hypothetical protein